MGLGESKPEDSIDCRIVIIGNKKGEACMAELSHLPQGATIVATGESLDELQTADHAFSDANVVLNLSGTKATIGPILKHMPHVQWVHSLTAGLDHLLCPELVDDETIMLTNAKGLFSSSLAEYVLGACSYFAKDFPRLDRNKNSKLWDRFCVKELRGSCMGIIGYGSIGQACAKLAKAYGMRVIGLRRRPKESDNDPFVDEMHDFSGLNKLMEQSDYLVVAAALTSQTKNMISAKQFALSKQGQVFINIGRGPLVVETDLISALSSGALRGAALDVFCNEPLPIDSELWNLSNVLLSPHNADMTVDFKHQSVRLFCDNCYKFLAGDALINIVDKKAGY